MPNSLWTLVLAAGSGRRLAGLTGGIPKQYWSPNGSQTLLEATLDRTSAVSLRDETVVVVDWSHVPYVRQLRRHGAAAHWLAQPSDRGTATGVLLGLEYIASLAPDAIVLLTPSDQGVVRPDVFERGVLRAVRAVSNGQASIVIFGAQPDRPDADYGWITPEDGRVNALSPVVSFVEKPAPAVAARLFAQGALWNTMILVGRVSTFLNLYRQHLPTLANAIRRGMHGRFRDLVQLEAAYAALPSADFSRDLLEQADGLTTYAWPRSMGWSDLGTPDRLADWYRKLGCPTPPAFQGRPTSTVAVAC
jgi:mannose-1-phosphate guanylyltransferase